MYAGLCGTRCANRSKVALTLTRTRARTLTLTLALTLTLTLTRPQQQPRLPLSALLRRASPLRSLKMVRAL